MNNEQYSAKVARLKEIEKIVKDPESSLDKVDSLIEETGKIAEECYAYLRGLKEKVGTLEDPAQD